MKKVLLSCLIISSLALARENPFFPSEGIEDLPISSNSVNRRPQLKRSALTLPDSARILKQVTIKYQNLDGSLETKSITLDHNVDWHVPVFISQSYNNTNKDSAKPDKQSIDNREKIHRISDFINYSIAKNSIALITNDKLLRHFMLINPHRVVLDFKRDSRVKSKNIPLKSRPFTIIKYGNHSDYYRIVVGLDGKYHYELKKHSGKVVITLN
ncbi:MAG: AMIN domain-containing protein [Campylobacterota bacterium]|nr:AMIN domain-containing protein [Campylobacterota bacterium]